MPILLDSVPEESNLFYAKYEVSRGIGDFMELIYL